MASSQMPPEVLARIRAMPGNAVCMDCSNLNPQWASVSYGALMCLECSGQHRSLGVHLSFVRSIAMDSWTDRQIAAMEQSGGNQALVDFFRSKGIEKNMRVAQKYNTKQAAYYRERLTRRLDGKTEPPPDPGRYDPATGGSEAQGAEPLPGESVDAYNQRQARLKEEARERLRQKFGDGGMGGVGSNSNSGGGYGGGGGGLGDGLGGVVGGVAGVVGGVAGGAFGFLKEKVWENEDLRSTVRTSVGGLGDLASGAVGSLRQTVADGDLVGSLKRNATLEEGSLAASGLGWTTSTLGNVWEKGSQGIGGISDFFGDESGDSSAPRAPRCPKGYPLRTEPRSDRKCSVCGAMGTRYTSTAEGSMYAICTKCFEKPAQTAAATGSASKKKEASFDFDDDDWGNDAPPPKDPTKEDMDRLAKEMGMKLTSTNEPQARVASSSPPPASSGSAGAAASPEKTGSAASLPSSSPSQSPSPTKPKEKEKKGLTTADDFFSEFGM